MDINELTIGQTYIHRHSRPNQPDERVKVLNVYKDGSDGEKLALLQYDSGRRTEFNSIECERYLNYDK